MMTDSEIENQETYVDVRIWKIPKSDFDYWMQIVRAHGGNRQQVFRLLLDNYAMSAMMGQVHTNMKILEERVEALEEFWKREGGNVPKTFGGGMI